MNAHGWITTGKEQGAGRGTRSGTRIKEATHLSEFISPTVTREAAE